MASPSLPPVALSKPARKLWDKLIAQQRRRVERLRKELTADSTAPLAVYHKLGALAQALMSDRSATYRRQLSSGLAELVGRTPSVIYQARKFHRFYSTDQVAELEGKLSWGRIVPLLSIDDNMSWGAQNRPVRGA